MPVRPVTARLLAAKLAELIVVQGPAAEGPCTTIYLVAPVTADQFSVKPVAVTLAVVGVAGVAGITTCPVPDSATVCLLLATPLLLSVIVRFIVAAPAAVGLKVTLIAQLAPAAKDAPQLFV